MHQIISIQSHQWRHECSCRDAGLRQLATVCLSVIGVCQRVRLENFPMVLEPKPSCAIRRQPPCYLANPKKSSAQWTTHDNASLAKNKVHHASLADSVRTKTPVFMSAWLCCKFGAEDCEVRCILIDFSDLSVLFLWSHNCLTFT